MADEDLGTAYAGQQEDINDKLLLDLAWERQQKKVNSHIVDMLKIVTFCLWKSMTQKFI